jgi:hypothetical protein
MFRMGFFGQTKFQSFMFQMARFSGQIKFQWFMFRMSFTSLCFNGLYHAFQAETWVDLRWCAHNDLCELNVNLKATLKVSRS